MKRVISLIVAVVLCFSLSCTVFADEFVGSITEKGSPEIVPVKDSEGNDAIGKCLDEAGNVTGYIYEECLLITPVSQAEKSDKIPDEAEDVLLNVYTQLKNGTMDLPYEKYNQNIDKDKMVIKDLFDVTWLCNDDAEHTEGTIKITFNLGVSKNTKVYCMSYKNNEWNPAVSCVNNGDGTVTCEFGHFCPVAFAVSSDSVTPPSQTGDNGDLTLWIVLMSVSVVALGAVLVLSRRKAVQ